MISCRRSCLVVCGTLAVVHFAVGVGFLSHGIGKHECLIELDLLHQRQSVVVLLLGFTTKSRR